MKVTRRTYGKRIGVLSALLLFAVVCAFAAVGCAKVKESHKYVEHAATESTCTQAGNDLYYTCEDCDKIFDADKNEIAAVPVRALKEHEWDEGVKTADADCEHGEAYTLTCSVGGETKIEYRGNALGHVWGEYTVTENDLMPNCTEEGTQTAECTRCHAAHNTIAKPALGHSYGELIAKVDATVGTSTENPCKTGLDAHYYCEACKSYFDAEKNRTTLDALTIDRHESESNLKWNTTATRHEHVCKDCGEKMTEGEHEFADWSAFECAVCDKSVSARAVYAFDDIKDYCRSNWEPVQDYAAEVTALPQGVTLPQDVINVGDKALCFTANRDKGEGKFQIWPALYIDGLKDIIANAENSYKFTIWLYATAAAKSGGDNWFVFGDATLNSDGYYFDSDISSQSPMNKNAFTPNFAANSWYSFTLTVAEIKAACANQGRLEAGWIHFSFEATQNMKLYFYAAQLYPEQTYTITKPNGVNTFVKNHATDTVLPLSTVKVEAEGLGFGKGLKVTDNDGKTVAVIYGNTGTFTMPYSNVTLTEIDVLNVPLETLNFPLYTGNIALPKTHEAFYDSYTIAIKKDGQPLSDDKYTYNETTHVVTFSESGTYTVEYTLTKAGQESIPVLTRTVNAGVLMAYDSADKFVKHGWGGAYDGAAETLPQSVGVPAQAMNTGNVALKFTPTEKEGNYQIYPALQIGALTTILQIGDDGDYISVWLYISAAPANADNWYMVGNKTDGNVFGDVSGQQIFVNNVNVSGSYTGYPDAYVGNGWFELKFRVKELKAQIVKQGADWEEMRPEWLLLSLGFAKTEGAAVWVYSAEYHKGEIHAIDASNVQNVTVAQSAKVLQTVTVDATALEYGKAVKVTNSETNEVIATVIGSGTFVMPNASVSLSVVDVFEQSLSDVQLPILRGSVALPEEYRAFYDSYTLTVKKDGTDVAADKYTFDSQTETIAFTENGVYELTYMLTKGNDSGTLSRRAVVGVINPLNDITTMGSWWWKTGENWSQEIVDTDSTIGKPDGAADIGNKLLKCTVTSNSYISPVFALGDFFMNLDAMQDDDSIRIWMYYTNTWGATALHYYAIGQQNISDAGDKTTNLPSTLGSADNWVALDISISEIKTQIQNGGAMYGYNAQNAWLHTMMNASGSVYFYSIEFHKAA